MKVTRTYTPQNLLPNSSQVVFIPLCHYAIHGTTIKSNSIKIFFPLLAKNVYGSLFLSIVEKM
jgi:hypothetical protein